MRWEVSSKSLSDRRLCRRRLGIRPHTTEVHNRLRFHNERQTNITDAKETEHHRSFNNGGRIHGLARCCQGNSRSSYVLYNANYRLPSSAKTTKPPNLLQSGTPIINGQSTSTSDIIFYEIISKSGLSTFNNIPGDEQLATSSQNRSLVSDITPSFIFYVSIRSFSADAFSLSSSRFFLLPHLLIFIFISFHLGSWDFRDSWTSPF